MPASASRLVWPAAVYMAIGLHSGKPETSAQPASSLPAHPPTPCAQATVAGQVHAAGDKGSGEAASREADGSEPKTCDKVRAAQQTNIISMMQDLAVFNANRQDNPVTCVNEPIHNGTQTRSHLGASTPTPPCLVRQPVVLGYKRFCFRDANNSWAMKARALRVVSFPCGTEPFLYMPSCALYLRLSLGLVRLC